MTSSDPAMRRCRSSDRTDGTIRSWSPLAMRVGCVITDRSDGAERPKRLMACSWVPNARRPMGASRSTVRSCNRARNAFAARLPTASRLKNRNSFGSDRVSVARRTSKYVVVTTLSMSFPPRGPVPVSTSFRTRPGCATTRSCAIIPPIENANTSTWSYPRAVMKVWASSAAASIVRGTVPDEPPTPCWSKVITCRCAAIASTIRGSQLSRVAARCTKKTTGTSSTGPSSR